MKAFLPMECQCSPTVRGQNIGREQKGTKSIKILVFYGQVSLRFSGMSKSRTRWLKFGLSSSLFRLSQLMPSCLLGSSNAKSGGRKERERVRLLRTNTFILWKQCDKSRKKTKCQTKRENVCMITKYCLFTYWESAHHTVVFKFSFPACGGKRPLSRRMWRLFSCQGSLSPNSWYS